MERFDFVVIGGGHNGLTIAAYLAKSGCSVAVVEARGEIGGCMDFSEVKPGCIIQPHAMMNFGNAAPAWDHLDLWRFGHRVAPFKGPFMLVTSEDRVVLAPELQDPKVGKRAMEILKEWSTHDAEVWEALTMSMLPHLKEVLRSIFWVPPWPNSIEYEKEELPWYQTLNKVMPGMFQKDWLELSLMEIMDDLIETEPLKAFIMYESFYEGIAPQWRGQAIPSFGAIMLGFYSHSAPVGGMHMYAHALKRCAVHHGATFMNSSPVDEIIVKNNRAVGVRLADNAHYKEKLLMADKAVISAVDTQQTFLKMIGHDHVDKSFRQKVADIDLKGGSIHYSHVIARDIPRCKGEAGKVMAEFDAPPAGYAYPMDSWQGTWLDYIRELDGLRKTPEYGPGKAGFVCANTTNYDPTLAPEGITILGGMETNVPPPEYHADGPDAMAFEGLEAYNAQQRKLLFDMAPNMEENLILHTSNTPLESEFRNAGLCGGTWCGPAESADQWWSNRPLPELSRYRAPIDGLYLCHQSQYPGGLCLMAVGYNLMHILIDDGLVEPKAWWYPNPWHVKDGADRAPKLDDIKF